MRRRLIPFFLLLLLAACGTPQDRCATSVAREIRTLDGLIAETRENLARGYRYETEQRNVTFGVAFCSHSRNVGVCLDNTSPSTIRRAVAIDPQAEERKLATLQARRARLASATCTPDGSLR